MEYNPNDIHNLIQQEKWKPIRQIIKHIIETNKIPIPRKLKNTYKNIQRIKQPHLKITSIPTHHTIIITKKSTLNLRNL